ncbi:MAG: hypothetical protein KAH22_08000 [Thiotrichaceae bacterium]|nr:hypothetical protein [Thiotrichaceae bacterium]
MTEILIATFTGLLIGLSISLIILPFHKEKQLKKERLQASLKLYHELLLKKRDSTYKYSPTVRKTINLVHMDLLLQAQNGSLSIGST